MNSKPDPDKLAQIVAESAQQIWLAGLGAVSMAEKESSKFFDALSRLSENIQSHTLKTAGLAKKGVKGGKNTVTETLDRVEELFELRVARALNALQIPTARDIKELTQRVDRLSTSVDKLRAKQADKDRPASSGKKRKKKKKAAKRKKRKAARKKTGKKSAKKKKKKEDARSGRKRAGK